MNELAQNLQGARIETHPQTRELAVYKFRTPGGPGAPGKVVGPNRMHLHVPPTTSVEDFQRLVNFVSGRYKLVQVDEFRRAITGAEAFYLDIMDVEGARGESGDERDDVLRETVRANARMAETIVDRFAAVVDSAARLIAAADGAGLPTREPLPSLIAPVAPAAPTPPPVEEAPPPSPLQAMMMNTIGQAGPLIQHLILTKVLGLPPEVASKMIAGQLATVPTPPPTTEAGASAPTAPPPANGNTAAPSSATPIPATPVGVDPNNPMAYITHLGMIETLLSKREAVIARELIAAMTGAEADAWRVKVCAMSAADAATAIRAEIAAVEARRAKTGGAS